MDERKKLALEKGLIVNEDCSIYRKVLDLYKEGFEMFLNHTLKIKEYDKLIDDSNLYFGVSTTKENQYKSSKLDSKYLVCLNQFYVEKLSINDINTLKNKDGVDSEVANIIMQTFVDIITKDGATSVSYVPVTPDSIVPNPSIVLSFMYGKNSKSLTGEAFKENLHKQREFIKEFSNKLEKKILDSLGVSGKVLVDKIV